MKKRVVFTFVEAGLGHIMPEKAVMEVFKKKYGDKVDVVESYFFTETNNKKLIKYQKYMSDVVKRENRHTRYGMFLTRISEWFGVKTTSFFTISWPVKGATREGVKHMQELNPDVVFTTHWATNYYAEKLKNKPLTIMYCPDAVMNRLFEYNCDLTMISMPSGYKKAIKKKRFKHGNLKQVPFLIRNQAFDVPTDKKTNRENLCLPLDKFTILLAEGGYGIGRMQEIVEKLIKTHLPITVIPVCGKNTELFEYFKTLKSTEEVTFNPIGYTDRILEMEAASDLFLGKSGNIIAEPTFFGVPSIITKYATKIEQNIGEHYINEVGSAMKEFNPDKVVKMIESFVNDYSLLEPYIKNAKAYHSNYGAEAAADAIWDKIKEKYKLED